MLGSSVNSNYEEKAYTLEHRGSKRAEKRGHIRRAPEAPSKVMYTCKPGGMDPINVLIKYDFLIRCMA